jgi:hypothetical protein
MSAHPAPIVAALTLSAYLGKDWSMEGWTTAAIAALGGGWVGEEALAIGLYAALVAPSFADAIRLAANHGGDSDSTASIAGQPYGVEGCGRAAAPLGLSPRRTGPAPGPRRPTHYSSGMMRAYDGDEAHAAPGTRHCSEARPHHVCPGRLWPSDSG